MDLSTRVPLFSLHLADEETVAEKGFGDTPTATRLTRNSRNTNLRCSGLSVIERMLAACERNLLLTPFSKAGPTLRFSDTHHVSGFLPIL